MSLTLITPTGDRPEAFALCEKYMARQTKRYNHWIVYDDGLVPTKCTMGQEYIYCPQFRGKASLARKIGHAFSGQVKTDLCAFIEDDDWYHPEYLRAMTRLIGIGGMPHDIVGEGCALYYNVRERWWYVHENMRHASLCQTMVRNTMYGTIARLCDKDECPFLDVRLWKFSVGMRRRIIPPMPGRRLLVGIKSMPGRQGYGVGHRHHHGGINTDHDLAKLTELIGEEDARRYAPFYASANNTPALQSDVGVQSSPRTPVA